MEIQEEIILESSLSIEGQSLIMPFYGKITGCVNWSAMWWGWLKDVVIKSGGQSVRMGFGCGAGYTYCTWAITNVPASNAVQVTVYGTCDNGELIEAETQTVQTGANEYEVQYKYNGDWSMATTVQFTATTPLECDNANNNYCDSTIFTAPIIQLELTQNYGSNYGVNNTQICSEHLDWPSFSQLATTNPGYIPWQQVPYCFDRDHQKWRYNIAGGNVYMYWIYDFCEQNYPPLTIRYNQFDVPTGYPCTSIRTDVERHLHYNPQPPPTYLFKNLLTFHERAHMELAQELINRYMSEFQIYFTDHLTKGCLEFNPNDPNNVTEVDTIISKAINKALRLAMVDYNNLLPYKTDPAKALDTEQNNIHPRAIPDIRNVLNSIICQ